MLDRTKQPKIQKIKDFNFIQPEFYSTKNDLYEFIGLHSSQNPIVKLDFILPAYKFLSGNVLVPLLLSHLFGRTTKNKTTDQIAEMIDFYAISYKIRILDEFTRISFYSLSKFAVPMLNLAFEFLQNTSIDEKEFKIELERSYYNFNVNMQKTAYLADRTFLKSILKNYKLLEKEDFNSVSAKDCLNFYKKYFSINNAIVILSGDYSKQNIEIIKKFLDNYENKEKIIDDRQPLPNNKQSKTCISKEKAKQSTVIIGCNTINRNHPDFMKLVVANTILGGYFGSRLNKNIREEKGYTYGVYSLIAQRKRFGIFKIEAEIGSKYKEEYLKEVEKEVNNLKTTEIHNEELELVKNYLRGNVLSNFDGVFEQASILASLRWYNLDFGYYKNFLEKLDTITNKDVKNAVEKYLDYEKMTKIIVGRC